LGRAGNLIVTVLQAEMLPVQAGHGSLHCDPYCELSIRGEGENQVR
jgi:hypothetical protein